MPIPVAPSDPFTRTIAPALDRVRGALVPIGLRPYRVWLFFRMWNSSDRKAEGFEPDDLLWNEIVPSPKVRPFRDYVASMGGMEEGGGLSLSHITRALTRHELLGKGTNGEDLIELHEFAYVVAELGATHGRLYHPSSEPTLGTTQWSIRVRPIVAQPVLLPTPDHTASPAVEPT